MGELYCTHVIEEVLTGQPERTKRRDDPGERKRMDIKEKSCVRLYFITLFNLLAPNNFFLILAHPVYKM